jgi:putative hydrolase of the HAD superfamily
VLRAVVFDLFHTLTGLESEWAAVPFTSDLLGIPRPTWDAVLHTQSRWRLIGEERDPFRILRRLADCVDRDIPDARIREAVPTRAHRYREALANVPVENIQALRRLRDSGLRLGLISNADAGEIASWNSCPLCGLFDVELFSCDVGYAKPDREIFELCLHRLGVDADQCVFVGDGGSDELVAAKAAGLRTVFISGVIRELWPHRVAERLTIADHHIEQLPEIEHVVAELLRVGSKPRR